MLKIALLAALLSLGNAVLRINYARCVTRAGQWGETLQCPGGYAATGMCGSTSRAACGGAWYRIQCCAINRIAANTCSLAQTVKDAGAGHFLPCYGNGVVTAVCGSGKVGDCGRYRYTRIHCWHGSGLKVTGYCHWRSGKTGQTVYCSRNEVVEGVCSSGKNYDCNHHSHAIRCCSVH